MKDLLLWMVAGLVLIALFGDGGLTFSPDLSPALTAKLDVNYAPDQSTTTIEQQTNIDRLQTTVIYQSAPVGAGAGGVSTRRENPPVALVDAGPGRCAMQAGDVLEQEQGNGACFVWNGNRKFFINPNGNRWEVASTGQQPPTQITASAIVTTSVLLAPDVPRTLIEFQGAFLRNGGQLPWLWNLRSDDFKTKWLSQQAETWR